MPRTWDPGASHYVFISGKKGSGKSHLAYTIWDSYPGDRLVLDVTRDVTTDWLRPLGVRHEVITPDAIPRRWPSKADPDEGPVTLAYHPDMGEPDAVDNLDRALGLALSRKGVCVWIDEIGAMTRGNFTPPNLRRLLHYGRHSGTSAIMCGPRPIDVDPLCVAQADVIAVFRLQNPADRKRIAANAGIEPHIFDQANAALDQREYLWIDARSDEITHMPPLPPIRRTRVYSEVPAE